jgi:cation diffusion facilitator family transporter
MTSTREAQETFERTSSLEKNRVALSSVVAAFLLTVMKIIVGVITGSLGILSEAAHSLFDLFAAIVTVVAVRLSGKPPDNDHHFGHGKAESFSALIETLLLLGTCLWIINEAVRRIVMKNVLIEINFWAFAVMVISIIVNISRARALYLAAKKYRSQALEADALHFSSDILSSFVVILGLVLVKGGYPMADPIAALLVAAIVIIASFELGKRALQDLMDTAPREVVDKIEEIVKSTDGIIDASGVRVRQAGSKTFVDMRVSIPRNISFEKSHSLAENVEQKIMDVIPGADIIIHTDPEGDQDEKTIDKIRLLASDRGLHLHEITIHKIEGAHHVGFHMELDRNLSLKEAHLKASELENSIKEKLPEVQEVITLIDSMSEDESVGRDLTADISTITRLIEEITLDVKGIRGCHDVSIKKVGKGLFISLHCLMDDNTSLSSVHGLSKEIEKRVRTKLKNVTDVLVHAEPLSEER